MILCFAPKDQLVTRRSRPFAEAAQNVTAKFTTYFSTRNGTLLVNTPVGVSRPVGNDAGLLPYDFFLH